MASGFLARYSEELTALRRRAARFAQAHPKVASRLRLSDEAADDPHVERLVQSFAFVAARVRQKLDDEFPELTGSLMETLYPHYLAPIPSMMTVRLSPVAGLDAVQTVSRHTEISTETIENERCRFRTTQDVRLAPVALTAAKLGGQPIEAPLAPQLKAAAVLRLSLRPTGPGGSIGASKLSSLRLHLAGAWREATALHELIANHTVGIALARHADDTEPVFLSPDRIVPAGFEAEEGMLPYPASSFMGYRLLGEFFALPQKFLFFDIEGLSAWKHDTLDIFIYLDRADGALERSVAAENFVLNATPVVNLFAQRAEPVVVDGTRTEHALVPDARRHRTREVHSVVGVTLTDREGAKEKAPHFFEGANSEALAWQLRRAFDPLDKSSDVSIAFVERFGAASQRTDLVASIDTVCLNRDLPERLPFGGGHPRLELVDPSASVSRVEALSAPTPAMRFDEDEERRWRLVSHLNLNHLSLTDGNGAALKEMLRLYVLRDRREQNLMIDAIAGLSSRPAMARVSGGGMVPGTDVTLVFDPAQIDRGAAYLFASVLDRFFGLYTSINSFTRMTALMRGQDEPVARFPARIAERRLV
ncbi:type VI secretion system baseplate subunit TssF [Mesorhizobium sp. RP14(2022)]|uniref:Type VI secretion system baseplate subunit TssF n=1 Tax=Mesorhizobium liriopis TaxID=2953882 RepID=A0ABT1CAC0_9HYPH|nr:type VI secretion system baseplate subunit TssF [Mesorhizobium liriopis]MCO6051760.1 type VI secretion system baseplate subunit TssF [Mesorhizobium liriopis]